MPTIVAQAPSDGVAPSGGCLEASISLNMVQKGFGHAQLFITTIYADDVGA